MGEKTDGQPVNNASATNGANQGSSQSQGQIPKDSGNNLSSKENDENLLDGGKDENLLDGNPEPIKKEAPEKYEFKFAEGVQVDPKRLESFEKLAKELDLSNDKAQKIAEYDIKRQSEYAQEVEQNYANQQKKWLDDSKKIVADGEPSLKEGLVYVAKARDKFLSNEEKKQIEDLGINNHPVLLSLLKKVGKMLGEDKFVEGKNKADMPASKLFYPGMYKKD